MDNKEKLKEDKLAKEMGLDGFISKISLGNKVYGLKCEVITVHPIKCQKCGGSFELKYGNGVCQFCGTHYSTRFIVEEVSNNE